MKRGLVIGKFMPVHEGHMGLIRFALSHCDELIVSMTYRDSDPIPGKLRFEWLVESCESYERAAPALSLDDFDNESLPLDRRIQDWAKFLRRRFPAIDIVFSSESYGESLASELGIPHMTFDVDREKFPVSASMIRAHPFRNWNFIVPAARGYFVKKICLYGPESTGKSTLARKLAEVYQTEWVPEVARELISNNNFSVEDIIRIGEAQTERVIEKQKKANKILFCDTDLITTEIYCRHYLGEVPGVLTELEKRISYDLYCLFDINVPWVSDGLRDLGHHRLLMYDKFRLGLESRKLPYVKVSGDYQSRENQVREIVESWLSD